MKYGALAGGPVGVFYNMMAGTTSRPQQLLAVALSMAACSLFSMPVSLIVGLLVSESGKDEGRSTK